MQTITDRVRTRVFDVVAECQGVVKTQPFQHLRIALALQGEALVIGCVHNTLVVLVTKTYVVVCVVITTRVVQVVVLHHTGAKHLVHPVRTLAQFAGVRPIGILTVTGVVHHVVAQCGILRCSQHRRHIHRGLRTHAGVQAEFTLARRTLLGGDHYHTVGTTATVDGRSRSVLQYIQTLNISHIQGVDTQIRRYTIDNNQRVAVVDRTETTDLDAYVITGSAGIQYLYTADLTLQCLTNVSYRSRSNILGCHRTYRTGQVGLTHRTVTYYNDLFQHLYIRHKFYLDIRTTIHRHLRCLIAYIADLENCLCVAVHYELTIQISNRALAGTLYRHTGTYHRLVVLILHQTYDTQLCHCRERQQHNQ